MRFVAVSPSSHVDFGKLYYNNLKLNVCEAWQIKNNQHVEKREGGPGGGRGGIYRQRPVFIPELRRWSASSCTCLSLASSLCKAADVSPVTKSVQN